MARSSIPLYRPQTRTKCSTPASSLAQACVSGRPWGVVTSVRALSPLASRSALSWAPTIVSTFITIPAPPP